MKLTGVELRRITMPLVSPFRTSFGTQTTRSSRTSRLVWVPKDVRNGETSGIVMRRSSTPASFIGPS